MTWVARLCAEGSGYLFTGSRRVADRESPGPQCAVRGSRAPVQKVVAVCAIGPQGGESGALAAAAAGLPLGAEGEEAVGPLTPESHAQVTFVADRCEGGTDRGGLAYEALPSPRLVGGVLAQHRAEAAVEGLAHQKGAPGQYLPVVQKPVGGAFGNVWQLPNGGYRGPMG